MKNKRQELIREMIKAIVSEDSSKTTNDAVNKLHEYMTASVNKIVEGVDDMEFDISMDSDTGMEGEMDDEDFEAVGDEECCACPECDHECEEEDKFCSECGCELSAGDEEMNDSDDSDEIMDFEMSSEEEPRRPEMGM